MDELILMQIGTSSQQERHEIINCGGQQTGESILVQKWSCTAGKSIIHISTGGGGIK